MNVYTKWTIFFENRFGTGLEDTVFTEHLSRGFRQIRKGIPLHVFLAAACDPRTKNLEGIPYLDQEKVWSTIRNEIIENERLPEPEPEPSPIALDPINENEIIELEGSSIFSRLKKKSNLPIETSQSDYQLLKEQTIIAEINHYRRIDSIDVKNNPLQWWKDNERLFPCLSKISRKVLSIPSTSAASERVFSSGGRTITKLRSSLGTDNASDLIFLKGSWGIVQEYLDSEDKEKQSKKRRFEKW